MLKGAVLGALLGGLGVLLYGVCVISPGWLLLFIALDPSIVIYPIVGVVAGALIGAGIGAGIGFWVAVGALIVNSRHHLWKIWLRLDATLIDWLQKRRTLN